VWCRMFQQDPKWKKGRVLSQSGPSSYKVDIDGATARRHADHIRPGVDVEEKSEESQTQRPTRDRRPPRRFSPGGV
jgi:hypothetical protein